MWSIQTLDYGVCCQGVARSDHLKLLSSISQKLCRELSSIAKQHVCSLGLGTFVGSGLAKSQPNTCSGCKLCPTGPMHTSREEVYFTVLISSHQYIYLYRCFTIWIGNVQTFHVFPFTDGINWIDCHVMRSLWTVLVINMDFLISISYMAKREDYSNTYW